MKKRSKATDMHTLWLRKLERDLKDELTPRAGRSEDGCLQYYIERLLMWGRRMATRTAKKKGGLGRR